MEESRTRKNARADRAHSIPPSRTSREDGAPADQDVNVLRYNSESDHFEAVTPTHLFEDLEKYVARPGTPQQRLAPIAARSDEMQIPAAVNADQASGHGPALYK